MSSIIKVNTVQDTDGNNIINENANTITIGASGDTISIPAGATLANNGTATGFASIDWQSTIVTGATHTASANQGIWIDTTSNACNLTLPGSPSVGDQLIFSDFKRTWGSNAVTLTLNGSKYQGFTSPDPVYDTEGETVHIVYSGSTQGWIPINDGAVANETPQTYDITALVVAGGGSTQNGYVQGGGGAGGYRTTTITTAVGVVYTVVVGGGGAGGSPGNNGTNSSIAAPGFATYTSSGGGYGRTGSGQSGGSGAGTFSNSVPGTGGAGNSGGYTPAEGNDGGDGPGGGSTGSGGGGGAGAVGQTAAAGSNGGDGTSNSITGSAVYYAGGGAGGRYSGSNATGGQGGGGNGYSGNTSPQTLGQPGTANTGGGGGGSGDYGNGPAGSTSGGSGIVILSVPDAKYSGTTTGSPTVTTGVSGQTVIKFTGNGSYTS